MKKLIISLICLLTVFSVSAATRRALVIGIGDYPASSGWAKINGDKDIPMVEEMLLANGFLKQDIIELKNQQATCAAICQQFENLITTSTTGDFVYIHFSGHGQQITDLNGDEADGLDEAWIPYDAMLEMQSGVYEGENHLIDDQINHYLHRLRQAVGKEGKIIVVADACHSGDSTRGEEDEVTHECIRGTASIFTISNVKQTIKRLTSIFAKSKSPISTGSIDAPLPAAPEWIFISACCSIQTNSEYQGKGSLTTALYMNSKYLGKLSIQDMFKNIKAFYKNPANFRYTQTPTLEVTSGSQTDIFF